MTVKCLAMKVAYFQTLLHVSSVVSFTDYCWIKVVQSILCPVGRREIWVS